MRPLIVVLAVLFVALQGSLWFGDGSFTEAWRLERAIAQQQAENSDLRKRNAALAAEVRDLKSGLDAVEQRARNELGMIRDGEVFYRIIQQ